MAKEKDDEKAPSATPSPAIALQKPHCGIVMPISELDGLPSSHWVEVKTILIDAIEGAGFTADLVSEAEDVGTILKRIIQHLYDDPIVVCDVSGKNANVMFELGIRLAFDKPTIIVKDDKTGYSFDTSAIEHITYPRDLRFSKIVEFQRTLADKVKATYEAGKKPDFSPFLKHFGQFTVAKLDKKEVSKDQFLFEQMAEVRSMLNVLLRRESVERERVRELDDSYKSRSKTMAIMEELTRLQAKQLISPSLTPTDLENIAHRVRRELNHAPHSMSFNEYSSIILNFAKAYPFSMPKSEVIENPTRQ